MSNVATALPTIALVTPSFNQASYLESTLISIHSQNYPQLQHVVMDGGSTDGSVEVIRRYAERLQFWCSGKDAGQYDAINRGFAHTQGQIMGWLNSDDLHLPWTLRMVGEIFAEFPEVQWLTSAEPLVINQRGIPYPLQRMKTLTTQAILHGEFLPGEWWHGTTYIQQEATFWRRELWEKVGGLDTSYDLAGDFDLWLRFARKAPVSAVLHPLAAFRSHEQQRSRNFARYREQALDALSKHGLGPPSRSSDRWRRFFLSLPDGCRKRIGRQYMLHPRLEQLLPGVYLNHFYYYNEQQHRWNCWKKW